MQALNQKQSSESKLSGDADSVAMEASNMRSPSQPEALSVPRGRRLHRVFQTKEGKLTRLVTGSWARPEYGSSTARRRPDGDCDIARRGGLALKSGNADGVKPLPHSASRSGKHRPHTKEGKR